ncbi:MAG: hypothetical protein JO257_10965 [Deltaproteobacteria bacterium]|nr:hypothetical protein [Deltaproteobacteria bacterium]
MKSLSILVGLGVVAASPLASAAPDSMTFAGRLSTSAGPVSGAQLITFKVFDGLTGGTPVWNDTISVTADNGLVFATLGTVGNPLDATVFGGSTEYLEITIGSETLTPRLPLSSVPYAISASTADKLGTITPAKVVQSITAGAGLAGGGSPSNGAVSLSVDTTTIQARVTGSCASGSSIRAIAGDGTVSCQPDTNSGGTISGVAAGTGLTGGGASGAVTLSVNTSVIQSRVSGTCAPGTSIRAIAGDGTVTCQPDTNSGGTISGVTAGTGLTGGGSSGAVSLSVDTSTIQARVTGACGVGSSIRAIAADGTVTCQNDVVGMRGCVARSATTAAVCNAGESLSGGGCISSPSTGRVRASYPVANSWQCDGDGPLTAYAMCCQ